MARTLTDSAAAPQLQPLAIRRIARTCYHITEFGTSLAFFDPMARPAP